MLSPFVSRGKRLREQSALLRATNAPTEFLAAGTIGLVLIALGFLVYLSADRGQVASALGGDGVG